MSADYSNSAIPTVAAELIDDQHMDVSQIAQATAVTSMNSLRQDASGSVHNVHAASGVILVDAQPISVGAMRTNFVPSICIDRHRAGFLSMTLCKKPASLGISMKTNDDGKVYISRVQPDSPLVGSALQAGDILLSINGKHCKTTRQVGDLLHSLTGSTLTIVVQNMAGDPSVVEVMVEKRTPHSSVGIAAKKWRYGIEISKIDQNGLLACSLLNIGDKLLSVNGIDCQHVQAQTAMGIIQSSPRYVTILARTCMATGIVLQEESLREPARSGTLKGEGGAANRFVVLDGVLTVIECLAYLSMSG